VKGFLDGLDVRRLRTWLGLAIAAAAVLLIVTTFFSAAPATTTPVASTSSSSAKSQVAGQDIINYQNVLAASVASALSVVKGAGDVRVTLSLHGGPGYLYAFNQTTRRQTTGSGSSTVIDITSQTTLATAGSAQTPVLTQETAPKVEGALIVASGAANPVVREELSQAAQALLDLPAYAIEVLPAGGGR
jgi:stage III sporulation protein AG